MCLQFYTIISTEGFNSANNKNTLIFVYMVNALRSMYPYFFIFFAQYFDKSVVTETVRRDDFRENLS